MLRLGFRNLFQSKVRLVVSIGGVALSLLLILSLDAVMTGVERQVTAYIDHSSADVWVAQENVRNMHMAYSALPASVVTRVKTVPGVESATSILFFTNLIEIGQERSAAYVIGLPKQVDAGGPWRIAAGKTLPGTGEIILDRGVVERNNIALGDKVKVLGEEFKVAGLSEGTMTLSGSVAFISKRDWYRLQGSADTISFVLVRVRGGEAPETVAVRIEKLVDKVTAQTQRQFANNERRVVDDMSTDLITIMNLSGFLIGLAVMALTVYTATLARRSEYGVLKALGARNSHLYRTVLCQAFLIVAIGLGLGLAFTLLLILLLPGTGLGIVMELSSASLVKSGSLSLAIAALSAILPILQIAGLDPALVFRGK